MKRYPNDLERVLEAGAVGDILWQPVGAQGPIELEDTIRALTLVQLRDLPDFVARGNRVLLMIGPCGKCNQPKGRILHAILNQRRRLISDLVVDSRSAGQLLDIMREHNELPLPIR
jgi:DNA-binding transcriptional regulator LsrR (DeoR family)